MEELVLGLFEQKLVKAQLINQVPKEFLFRNVMVTPRSTRRDIPLVLEDALTSFPLEGVVFLAVHSKTAH